jgi:hypothetical protein
LTTIQEEELTAALDDLSSKFAGNVSSVSRVINPLLNVWSLAHEIDPEVARPLEGLLSALAHRVLTTQTELGTAIDAVRLALATRQAVSSEVGAS